MKPRPHVLAGIARLRRSCPQVRAFLDGHDGDVASAWGSCQDGVWMLHFLALVDRAWSPRLVELVRYSLDLDFEPPEVEPAQAFLRRREIVETIHELAYKATTRREGATSRAEIASACRLLVSDPLDVPGTKPTIEWKPAWKKRREASIAASVARREARRGQPLQKGVREVEAVGESDLKPAP